VVKTEGPRPNAVFVDETVAAAALSGTVTAEAQHGTNPAVCTMTSPTTSESSRASG
jgi:hypothetical protein